MFAVIDWLTLRLPTKHLSASTLNALQARQGMLSKTAATGELLWRASTREELRAGECRRLGWRLNNHWLELNGSPARLLEKNNVFGDRDPQRCAIEMIGFFERRTGIPLPADLTMWDCTRLDVTQNYMLPSEADVRDALRCMSTVHGGRLRVELRSGSPCWNPRSSLRSGKAYDKGQTPQASDSQTRGIGIS